MASRYDYPDPGTDPAYCDRISDPPGAERDQCPDCQGSGEIERQISDDILTWDVCEECHGRGYYDE